MKKHNMPLGESNGYADFYDADDVDGFMQKVDKLQIRNEASERATTTNDIIHKIKQLFREG